MLLRLLAVKIVTGGFYIGFIMLFADSLCKTNVKTTCVVGNRPKPLFKNTTVRRPPILKPLPFQWFWCESWVSPLRVHCESILSPYCDSIVGPWWVHCVSSCESNW